MAKEENNIKQNDILNEARKNDSDITVILVNGVQLKGKIKSFDDYTILLQVNNNQNLIFSAARQGRVI